MENRWRSLAGLVLLLAILLRIPQLNGSFWLDEAAQSLESARPFNQQLNIQNDFQPPLLHLIVHFALLVSRSEWWLRLFGALIPGILSILGTMLIARKILPKKFALQGSLLVGLLIATNSYHLFYSQELRPYALPMMFAVWSWWQIIQPNHRPKQIVVWSLLSLLGLYSSYLYPFLFIAQLVYVGQKFWKDRTHRFWLAGWLSIILGYLPWLPSFWSQLQAGQLLRLQLPNWETAVSANQLKVLPLVLAKFIFGVLDTSLNPTFIISFSIICVLIGVIAIGLFKHQSLDQTPTQPKQTKDLLLIWFLIPLLTAWLVSFFVPVIQPKRIIFLLPVFYLLIVWLFTQSQALGFWLRRAGCALIGMIILINLISVYQFYTNARIQRENWRDVLTSITISYPQAFTLSSFPAPFAPIAWYRPGLINTPLAQDLASGILFIDTPTTGQQIISEINLIKLSNTMIYFEYLTDLTDPNHYLRDAIESSGYELRELLDYPGIGFVRFMNTDQLMHLGIDTTSLLYNRGVSRYTSNLLIALNLLPQMKFSLYGSTLRRKRQLLNSIQQLHLKHATPTIQMYPISVLSKLWQVGLNPIASILPTIDVFHAWDWHLPPDKKIPMVTTIHDLAMLRMPHIAHPSILSAHQVAWKKIKDSQTHVIAVSQTTKRDVIELLGLEPQRVHLVYEALTQETIIAGEQLTEEKRDQILSKFNLNRPFFLFVGTQEPRKNLSRAIQAWQAFAKEFDLVIAGASGWNSNQATNFKVKPIFLGSVNDLELAGLYNQASIFLYPSLYEGFGLPILEAFHHGTPVVTSRNSGMAEVAGNAAELVDPLEVESIIDGIKKILNQDQTTEKIRDQRMILRLQLFSWESTAHQTLAVYQKTKQQWIK